MPTVQQDCPTRLGGKDAGYAPFGQSHRERSATCRRRISPGRLIEVLRAASSTVQSTAGETCGLEETAACLDQSLSNVQMSVSDRINSDAGSAVSTNSVARSIADLSVFKSELTNEKPTCA